LAVAATIENLVADLEADVRRRSPGSIALAERGTAVLPGGASGDGKTWWPLYFARARGSKVSDVDGNEYIDLVLGIGPNVLGHTDPAIVAAVSECFGALGGAVAGGTALEVELAERIKRVIPAMEQMRFVTTGSEATMMAIRAARAYTGKQRIAKFEGHYHGQHDEVLISAFGGVAGELRAPVAVADCVGLNDTALRNAIVLPWNDIEAVEQILSARAGEIAALICEPVPCVPQGGEPPQEGFLPALRELTERLGILLIFDEVVTGLRMREGSASAYFGVAPDLITLGKVAGGGLPVGVYGGRAEIMCTVVGPEADPARKMFQSGTFSGSPVVMAAGIAVIDQLADGTAHERADATALPVQVTGISSWFGVYFTERKIHSRRDILSNDALQARAFSIGLLARGVFYKPAHPGFTSASHTNAEIDHVLEQSAELFTLIAQHARAGT
jgi:glutamate-1-semialdehyde 2,1-aminomutase